MNLCPDCGSVLTPVRDWFGKSPNRVLKQIDYKGRPVWYCEECDSCTSRTSTEADDSRGKAAAGGLDDCPF